MTDSPHAAESPHASQSQQVSHSESPLRLLEPARLVPLLEFHHVEDAAPLARAFVAAGLRTLEIALRTKGAPNAIRAIRAQVPEALPGAGNVMTPLDLHLARECGMAYIAAGHHATERYGVQALGARLGVKFGIEVEFVDIDNPA